MTYCSRLRVRSYLLTVCLSLPILLCALFYTSAAHADVMPLPGGPKLSDCSKARDPARCEARIQARQACSSKRGDSKRICMEAYLVSPDCARADQPNRCVVQKQAEQTCRGKQGKTHTSCMQAELKKKPKSNKMAINPNPAPAPASTPANQRAAAG
jgi:hypothetical protein